MITNYQDLTLTFNTNNAVVIDTSGWDYVITQFVGPTGTISITNTNDGGAVAGTSDGGASTATNFIAVQATLLTDGTKVTAVAAAGLYRTDVVGRYLKYGGAAAAATKVLVKLAKIC